MNRNQQKTILIICRGNLIRSPFAEAVINKLIREKSLEKKFIATSRGIQGTKFDPRPVKFTNIISYPDEYSLIKPILDELNIDLTNHVSKPVEMNIVNNASVVLAVDEKCKNQLIRLFPNSRKKIFKLSNLINSNADFSDPEGKGNSQQVLSDINNTIIAGFTKLLKITNRTTALTD